LAMGVTHTLYRIPKPYGLSVARKDRHQLI
jgi:hypothetical protein